MELFGINKNNSYGGKLEIQEKLSGLSLGSLVKIKDELGGRMYNEAFFGKTKQKIPSENGYKRSNKNRPCEMSAKKFISNNKNIELNVRDPRFDKKCGEYNSKIFKKSYSFISEIRENEILDLKSQFRTEVNEAEKKRIKFLVKRLENQNCQEEKRRAKEIMLNNENEKIRQVRKEGKTPRYKTKNIFEMLRVGEDANAYAILFWKPIVANNYEVKNVFLWPPEERRTEELVAQFESLKNSGKLQKHLEKRRKKNVSKDRKKLVVDE